MSGKALLLVFTLTIVQSTFAQSDSLVLERVNKTAYDYKSFTLAGNKLFAINVIGALIIWDLDKMDIIHYSTNNSDYHFTAIARDRSNQIFLGTDSGDIFMLDPINLSFKLFSHDKYPVFEICFNSQNKMFLIIKYAVYDPITKKHWSDFVHSKNGMIYMKNGKRTYEYFEMPQITFIDKQDRIWMASSFGEFGGSLQIFDTKKEKILSSQFDSVQTGLLFPKSVFDDDLQNVYITSGLQHFRNSGAIYKINSKRNASKIYDSYDYRDSSNRDVEDEGIFVGPGAYNSRDNSIYFATTKGFYKSPLPANGKIKTPELVFLNPALTWDREPKAIGFQMAIKQVQFTNDNKLLFLTANDGFGIYDGKKLIQFK